MPHRATPGGYVYHAMNRAIEGAALFEAYNDYLAFEHIMAEACRRDPMRLLAYCLMPNHWHLLLWTYDDGDLARFMHWLTMTHVARWRAHRGSIGRGHLYQGPYKSVAVECDLHVLTAGRYIERNARTANLVQRAEEWRWSSLWRRLHPHVRDGLPPLSEWPADRPEAWVDIVNEPQTEKELEAMRQSLLTGRPFGSTAWQQKVAMEMGLDLTPRPRGRPRK